MPGFVAAACPKVFSKASAVAAASSVPLLLLLLLLPQSAPAEAQGGSGGSSEDYETKYVAHVMPWFEHVDRRGMTGNHWCDPDFGNSYYESAFGRYSSADPVIIRRQLLLMKYAGLDGVWIDLQVEAWLPAIRAIVKEVVDLGMNFAIVVDNYAEPEIVDTVKDEMQDFMDLPNYYRVFGRPILPYYEHPWRWGSTKMPSWRARDGHRPYIIGTFSQHPTGELKEGFDSLFFWHTPDIGWLEAYYLSPDLSMKVGSVFHGWREGYADRKHVAPYFGYLEDTLDLARRHKPYFAQLVTWNDYTEGTMFEPAWLSNTSDPNRCADPTKSLWSDEVKTCSQINGNQVFNAGGVIPPCLQTTFEARAAKQGGGEAEGLTMCSGSGDEPCADVMDCSRPLGRIFGLPRAGCPGGPRSIYSDLAKVAQAIAGLPVENSTTRFQAIVEGWEPPHNDTVAMSAAGRTEPASLGGRHAFAAFLLAGLAASRS
jgi:hypothetical protein